MDQAIIKDVEGENFEVEHRDNPTLTISEVNKKNDDTDVAANDLNFDSAAKFKK